MPCALLVTARSFRPWGQGHETWTLSSKGRHINMHRVPNTCIYMGAGNRVEDPPTGRRWLLGVGVLGSPDTSRRCTEPQLVCNLNRVSSWGAGDEHVPEDSPPTPRVPHSWTSCFGLNCSPRQPRRGTRDPGKADAHVLVNGHRTAGLRTDARLGSIHTWDLCWKYVKRSWIWNCMTLSAAGGP